MSDDEIYLSHGSPTHFEMDEAFCARLQATPSARTLAWGSFCDEACDRYRLGRDCTRRDLTYLAR
jgi:hypothetical protein